MQKRTVSFIPLEDTNAYIERVKELLSNFAEVKRVGGVKKALVDLFIYRKRSYDIVWFNFEENQIVDEKGNLDIFATIKLLVKTYIITKLSAKSVFVRHNHYPHKTVPASANTAKKIVDFYEKFFDEVITHSGAEVTSQKIYCPHPLYKTVEQTETSKLNLPDEYFLVFGRIVPYKKIEKLIENFPHNKTLVVAGAVGDKAYADKLSQIKHPGLVFLPGYLTEAESQQIVGNSTAVIISHADKDMIVSGSFFYAISIQTPVIAIQTDFFNWVKDILPPRVITVANNLEDIHGIVKNYQPVSFDDTYKKEILGQFGDKVILGIFQRFFNES